MTVHPVPIVRAGDRHDLPPVSGASLTPADALTNPARWSSTVFGSDPQDPPTVVAGRLVFTWAQGAYGNATQWVPVAVTAGHTYTMSATVTEATAPWRLLIPWAEHPQALLDGPGTATFEWTAPASETIQLGIGFWSPPAAATHTLAAIGVWDHADPATVWQLTELEPCRIALPFQITHGRSNTGNQPDPPTCTFTWLGPDLPFERGRIEVDLPLPMRGPALYDDPEASYDAPNYLYGGGTTMPVPRFRGRITSIVAVESGLNVRSWRITATGEQARLGRAMHKSSRPAETDVARVTAMATAAGRPIRIAGTHTVALVADDIDRDVQSAVWEITDSSAAILFQDRAGQVWYELMDHRYGGASGVLPSCAILSGLEWDKDDRDILNHITVRFGPDDDRVENTYRDDTSINTRGRFDATVDTLLADPVDANALAATILLRRSEPWWTTSNAVIRTDHCTEAELRSVMGLEVGQGVMAPIPKAPGPVPSTPELWTVEGWVETWDTHRYARLQLALSDRRRWGWSPLMNWGQKRTQTWGYWAAGTWLDQLSGSPLLDDITEEVPA